MNNHLPAFFENQLSTYGAEVKIMLFRQICAARLLIVKLRIVIQVLKKYFTEKIEN